MLAIPVRNVAYWKTRKGENSELGWYSLSKPSQYNIPSAAPSYKLLESFFDLHAAGAFKEDGVAGLGQ